MQFDELQLFRGYEYKVNDQLTILHPTLDEICVFGEQEYYSMVSALTAIPSYYKVQLFDMGIDYGEMDEFDFFCWMCKSISLDLTPLIFKDVDLSELQLAKKEDGEIFLCNKAGNVVIDRLAYILLAEYLRKLHFFEKKVEKCGNKKTRDYVIERDRRKLEREKNKPYKSMLTPLISALVNCEQFKYTHKSVWELPIYTFTDSVHQIQRLKHANDLMRGYYAGTVDLTKIDKTELNWIKNLA